MFFENPKLLRLSLPLFSSTCNFHLPFSLANPMASFMSAMKPLQLRRRCGRKRYTIHVAAYGLGELRNFTMEYTVKPSSFLIYEFHSVSTVTIPTIFFQNYFSRFTEFTAIKIKILCSTQNCFNTQH